MAYIHFIGIDVSKGWFDAALAGSPDRPRRFANAPEGFAAFREAFGERLRDAFVVLEATGGYEAALLAALVGGGVAVHRAAPSQARSFCRSLGGQAKTDGLDAKALARMAAERHAGLRLFELPSKDQAAMNDLLTRRADLLAAQVAEKNRAQHPRYANAVQSVRESLAASLAFLAGQLKALDAEVEALVGRSAPLRARFAAMTSIVGIGAKTAYILQGHLPELGALTRRQAASLAGCAPHARDSGLTRGHRSVFGGRSAVKRALFTAAMSARTHDPAMRAFFDKLTTNGKPKMVALVAIMRKIVVRVNAILRPLQANDHGR